MPEKVVHLGVSPRTAKVIRACLVSGLPDLKPNTQDVIKQVIREITEQAGK